MGGIYRYAEVHDKIRFYCNFIRNKNSKYCVKASLLGCLGPKPLYVGQVMGGIV